MNHTTLGLIAILTAATLVIGTLAAASPAFASLSAKRIKQRHQLTSCKQSTERHMYIVATLNQ